MEKELRLSLICYGGVSLAVYMHGVTKEIWHMLRSSRSYHDDDNSAGSEEIYVKILRNIERDTGIKLRIIADIIAGSSAGGINGIFLSKAIVSGQSLDPLTNLWLDMADVDKLLDPDARPLSRFSKFWATPLVWLVLRRKGGAVEKSVSKEKRSEVAHKLSRFIRARWFAPPFGGEQFSAMLLSAMDSMENAKGDRPLLPPAQPLDLFVTVTDFYGHYERLRLNSPTTVSESEHRLTIHFSSCDNAECEIETPQLASQFASAIELTFAARATASFPGAFPPFSTRELDIVLARRGDIWHGREDFLKRILPHQFKLGIAQDTALIDGSVLNNAPFKQAISALRNRPARREVDRRFVFIDPSPNQPVIEDVTADNRKLPGFFSTIFGASSNIPRQQPIRDSLEDIQAKSDRILRMQSITDHLKVEIEHKIEAMLGSTFLLSRPTSKRITKWRLSAHQKSSAVSGLSFAVYGHLKIAGIVDDIIMFAQQSMSGMAHTFYSDLKNSLWRELDARGLDIMSSSNGKGVTKTAFSFFREHDLRFRIRRLRFLARRLSNEIENNPDFDDEIGEVLHKSIYDCLALYLERETSSFHGEQVDKIIEDAINNPSSLLDFLSQKRDLEALDQICDAILCDAMVNMPKEAQRIMLLGYIGYPLYDIATLPLLQGDGLNEFDPIKIDRISPDDAISIRDSGAEGTLQGTEFYNFGAFFSRSYRENDYLWGRLHGADRMIDILLSTLSIGQRPKPEIILEYKREAFIAIINAEEKRLNHIKALLRELRKEIANMSIDKEEAAPIR